ncbi:MAG: 1-acyl-sn-glycerol-3-phosphate acyltransferase [Alphaproteobacteria bacterium]|nr:1-acyl-sn-glycerol-3-phosphate acyltransferase [Alphaproteobacteria bacterium]
MPAQAFALVASRRMAKLIPLLYHRACLWVFGMVVERRGLPSRDRPTLFVVNHCSYLDIMVLGSLIGGSFVAKAEVAGWPFFGWLARLQRTVFVERRRRTAAAGQRDEIAGRLEAGDDLILFPEGTSSDGNRILPFKTALFSVAERRIGGRPLTVQPVTIAYVRLDGIPLGHGLRPFYAWYGDMDLAGHIWKAAGLGDCTVSVEFHPPVTIDEYASRKSLAQHCHRVVAHGMARALAGRWPDPADAAAPAEAT